MELFFRKAVIYKSVYKKLSSPVLHKKTVEIEQIFSLKDKH